MQSTPPKTRRPLVLVCVMLALFMSAIEVTIVATAMPQIVTRLGGFSLYSWVFAAFLLTQTATTVMFGKLSDIYGRKPVIIGGITVFMTASLFCGLAWSMPSMIVFRLMQGVGAGAMQSLAVTIAGDLYQARERLRIQAALSSVWAIAAIAGPVVGGLIVERYSWSWIFWANIPIGILTIIGFARFLHETVEHRNRSIDYLGALLFSIAVAALLIVLTQGSTLSLEQAAEFAVAFVLAAGLFLLQERRAPEPMIALDLWGHRLVATANVALMFGTMSLIGLTTYLPIYIQGVQGHSAIAGGLPLAAMLFAWPLASAVSGRILHRFSMRTTLRSGTLLIPLGAVPLLFLSPATNPVLASIGPFLMGFGMGLLNITCVVMIQGSVEWSKRGSATASLIFSRTLGNTVGVSALGALVNYGIVFIARARGDAKDATPERIRDVLAGIGHAAGGGAEPALHAILDRALHFAFWGMFAFALVALAVSLSIPVREIDSLSGALSENKKT